MQEPTAKAVLNEYYYDVRTVIVPKQEIVYEIKLVAVQVRGYEEGGKRYAFDG